MADIKITNLPSIPDVESDDILLIIDVSDETGGPEGTDKKATIGQVKDLLGVVQTTGASTTDIMSQKAVSELLALKIFQSPTNGGLTEIQTRTVSAGEVYEVRKTSDDLLTTIYSDAAGTVEIVQNGTDNVSGSDGVVEFYVADGDYYIDVNSVKVGVLVSKLEPFNNVSDMTSSTYLSKYVEDTTIVWDGYYEKGDGGGNSGLLKFGAHTEDGGSIFSIDSNTYIEANIKGKKVNIKKFGCKVDANSDTTDGTPIGTDDYEAFYKCLTYTVSNGISAYIPSGNMLIGSTIDIDSLPYGDFKGVSIEGTGVKTGRTYTSQIKGKSGLVTMFTQVFDIALSKQRPIKLTGFGVISEDRWENLTVRAPLRAFDLYSCPQSTFTHLHFFGITSGLHTRACFLSEYKDITSNRCSEGVFCDGDDGAGGYGFADHCSFDEITNSGWNSTFGLRLRGCKAPNIGRVDGETGHTGNALILEGVKNTKTGALYMEAFNTTVPIVIKPIGGSSLDSLEDFSVGVELGPIHGLSNFGGTIEVWKGCIDIDIPDVRTTRVDVDNESRENEAGEWLKLVNLPSEQNITHYLRDIKIGGAYSNSDNPFSSLTNSVRSQAFNLNGNVIQRTSNPSFYGQTLEIGDQEVNTVNDTVKVVTKGGTLGVSLSINATTTSGSRLIDVDSTTDLVVGTLVSIGGQDGLKVTSIDRTGNKVFLGQEVNSNLTSTPVTYTSPEYLIIKDVV